MSKRNCSYMGNSACEASFQPIYDPDSKTARLMELIGYAIDTWALEYHLENLPKKIVFEQALDVMQIIETNMNSKGR